MTTTLDLLLVALGAVLMRFVSSLNDGDLRSTTGAAAFLASLSFTVAVETAAEGLGSRGDLRTTFSVSGSGIGASAVDAQLCLVAATAAVSDAITMREISTSGCCKKLRTGDRPAERTHM